MVCSLLPWQPKHFARVGVKHKTTALYIPSRIGAVERFNRVIKVIIQGAVTKRGDWKLAVKKAVWAYGITKNDVAGLSPFMMMRGRSPRCKFNPGWLGDSTVLEWSPEVVKERLVENQ